MGKESKIKKLFSNNGKDVGVPIDRGICGNVERLEDPLLLVERSIKDGADALLIQIRMAKIVEDVTSKYAIG